MLARGCSSAMDEENNREMCGDRRRKGGGKIPTAGVPFLRKKVRTGSPKILFCTPGKKGLLSLRFPKGKKPLRTSGWWILHKGGG